MKQGMGRKQKKKPKEKEKERKGSRALTFGIMHARTKRFDQVGFG
jgi:hypothetical protein